MSVSSLAVASRKSATKWYAPITIKRSCKTLESGRLPIYEPGLERVIAKARQAGRLQLLHQSLRKPLLREMPFSFASAPRRCQTATRT